MLILRNQIYKTIFHIIFSSLKQSSRRQTLITGVYLLLSCLPTSHTTVHAVPHTAVPIFGFHSRYESNRQG